MSGFVGIINNDGAPVDCELLDRLTDSLTFRGPDARTVWCHGSVGFGHTLFRTTREARYERQPFTLDQQVWIVADARVDGREDLARALDLDGPLPLGQTPDSELILRAYLKWGEACLDHLIGDFSFAIWDSRSRKLFCARDHFGVKLFYYAWIGTTFIFSNTIATLRLHPCVTDRLNERTLGDFLIFDCNWTLDTTFFADIQRLPAAHQLIVTNSGLERRKYWQLRVPERVSFRREEEYVEGFRERLEQAVGDRLRTERVSTCLSGGLDSTNIALAAINVAHRRGQQVDLKAFTTVYDTLLPDNEKHYSGIAAQSLNIPVHYLFADSDQPYDGWNEFVRYHAEPFHDPCGIGNINLYKSCSKHSAVLLDGSGGDEIFRPTNVATVMREYGLSHALADYCRTIFRHHFFPCAGTGILARFRKLFRPTVNPNAATLPDWLNAEFARRLSLEDRLPLWDGHTFDPLDALATPPVRRFVAPLWNRYLSRCDIAQYREHVEMRFPYLDLRVVRFALGLPNMPWAYNKHLLRRLGATTLPKEITSRPKTPLRAEPLARSLEQNKQLLLKLAEVPLVPLLEEMICVSKWRKSLRETSFESWPLWELLRVVTLNYWLEWNATIKQKS